MQTHLANLPFLFGYRPSSADFAIYGQLTQLIGLDPTSGPSPIKILLELLHGLMALRIYQE